MALTVNLYYTGKNGSAQQFAKEMIDQGVVAAIKAEPGNLKYDYFIPYDDPETLLLIDSWTSTGSTNCMRPPCRPPAPRRKRWSSAAGRPWLCMRGIFCPR